MGSNMAKKVILYGISVLLAAFSLAAEAKYYKWVDKDGVTQYGSVIPPEYAGQKTEQLDNGRVVEDKPKPVPGQTKAKPPKELTPAEIEQKRRDDALIGSYSSPDEIDRAMERELQQADARIDSINLQLQTSQEDLNGLNQQKSDLEKAKRPVGKLLQDRIEQVARRLQQLRASKVQTENEKNQIRARYTADKKRFIELSNAKPKDLDQ